MSADAAVPRVAIVTGAASGIGAACVSTLASKGYRVWASDIDGDGLARLAETGGAAERVVHDVTDEDGWDRLIERAGAPDLLVNAAGISAPSPVVATSYASWRRQIAVNLDGCFLGMRAALRAMIPAGRGVIVNIASVGSFRGTPGLSAYCAAKAGVHLLTRSAAREAALETPGVRVVSVHPGLIDTPGSAATLRGSFPSADDPAQAVLAAIPAGRMGTAAEAAALVAFLASDEASYLTGASFTIDGGMSA